MVSTRRTRFPSPPPNVALARPVPDDPPPSPPPLLNETSEGSEALKCSLLNTANSTLKPQHLGLAAEVQRGKHLTEHVIKAQLTEKSSSNDGDATASITNTQDMNPGAPKEESFSAAKISANLQMEKERLVIAALQRKRKSRPRTRAPHSRDNGQRNCNSTQHESFNNHSSLRALPINVLDAVQGVISARQSDEKARRTEEKMRKQKRRHVSREKRTFLKDMGVVVFLPGQQKLVSGIGKKQPSAASFLQNSIGKQGPRVSAEMSAKIAGKSRI